MRVLHFSLLTLFLLAYLVCITFGARRMIHIFQLNSYKPKVQLKWLFKNKKLIFLRILVSLAIIPMVVFDDMGITAAGILFIILAYTSRKRKEKKPLVYTKRVLRLIFTLSVLILIPTAIIFTWGYIDYENVKLIVSCYTVGCYILLPLIILLANAINMPVEKMINRGFIKDAERIISSVPGLKVVGITGSYGKTSVKYYLTQLLSAKYNVLMTPESYNTTMGVVRTIREQMRATHEVFVCEMGARNIGDIKEICDIVHPQYGIITSVGPQHLESFKTIENIKKTKFELADSLPKDGIAFLNGDDENIASVEYKGNKITYGVKNGDYRAENLRLSSKGTEFTVKAKNGEEQEFSTKLIGEHNVQNITGAIALAHTLGVPLKALVSPVRRLKGAPHRLELSQRGATTIIDDAYNSNPNGTKVALNTLAMFDGAKILVTPGMVELGEKQDEYNREFGVNASKVCDYIILVGQAQTKSIAQGIRSNASFNARNLIICDDIQEAFTQLASINTGERNKIVLLENDLPDNYL